MWVTTGLLIAVPCLLALATYDALAILLFRRGAHPLVPGHDLARALLQDLGLTVLYALTITPRVVHLAARYSKRARRLSLIMLGLGVAWSEVVCAAASRVLGEPPGLILSLVILVVIPVLLAPWYLQWVEARVQAGGLKGRVLRGPGDP